MNICLDDLNPKLVDTVMMFYLNAANGRINTEKLINDIGKVESKTREEANDFFLGICMTAIILSQKAEEFDKRKIRHKIQTMLDEMNK